MGRFLLPLWRDKNVTAVLSGAACDLGVLMRKMMAQCTFGLPQRCYASIPSV